MINYSSYTLTEKNYYPHKHPKKQIVIGNSFNEDMNHFNGWLKRGGGQYKKVANYSINCDGQIYEHFHSDYYSDFIPYSLHNKNIISIILVNEGWLEYDLKEKKYINCFGNTTNNPEIIEKRWRNHTFWGNYNKKQIDSLVYLTKYLLEKHNIIKKVLSHNTFVKDICGFEGVTYRSNWIKDSTDLSPSFDFEIFKNKVENNDI